MHVTENNGHTPQIKYFYAYIVKSQNLASLQLPYLTWGLWLSVASVYDNDRTDEDGNFHQLLRQWQLFATFPRRRFYLRG